MPNYTLTAREREIMELLALGQQPKQVARQLGIKCQVVSNTLTRVYLKLGAKNRTHALMIYLSGGAR